MIVWTSWRVLARADPSQPRTYNTTYVQMSNGCGRAPPPPPPTRHRTTSPYVEKILGVAETKAISALAAISSPVVSSSSSSDALRSSMASDRAVGAACCERIASRTPRVSPRDGPVEVRYLSSASACDGSYVHDLPRTNSCSLPPPILTGTALTGGPRQLSRQCRRSLQVGSSRQCGVASHMHITSSRTLQAAGTLSRCRHRNEHQNAEPERRWIANDASLRARS